VDETSASGGDTAASAKSGRPGRPGRQPRRAPSHEQRQRDAERSRARLLEAALEEFAAKGFAGARVADIAARAGLNTQLVSYYFGGKEGLYQELQRGWERYEASFARPEISLADLVSEYLHASLSDPRLTRLLAWRGLADTAEAADAADAADPAGAGQLGAAAEDKALADLRRRQANGELAAELDPGLVLLAVMGAVAAPVIMPQVARRICGLDPSSPEFEARYADQLKRMIRRLAE
jgi:TetR/AcrR family transcriptional regulator